MNIRTLNPFWLILISGLYLTISAGAFEGDYTFTGYDVSFRNGTNSSWGLTKEVYAEVSEISVSSSNTFIAAPTEWTLERSVFDIWSGGSENRLINYYSAQLETNSNMFGGTTSPGSNLAMFVTVGTNSFPLYFNTSTNVALAIQHVDDSAEAFARAGFGVLVRKGSGMNNASLTGNYLRYTIGNAAYGSTSNGWGNTDRITLEDAILSFDGSGNYTEDGAEWTLDRIITEVTLTNGTDAVVDSFGVLPGATEDVFSTNGTYSVLSDGTLLISSEIGMITNQISPDGNMAASALGIGQGTYAGASMTLVVKLPASMSTTPINAVYYIAELGEDFYGDSPSAGANGNRLEAGRSYMFLNNDGTFSLRYDYRSTENEFENNRYVDFSSGPSNAVSANLFSTDSLERKIMFDSGTYSIASNGEITLTYDSDGEEGTAQISENGEYVIFGFADDYGDSGDRIIGFGIRRNPPPPAPGPIVFNNDITMTSTGLVMTATLPTNYPIEGIATSDLVQNEWSPGDTYTSATGTITIHDPEAAYETTTFYAATFVPW